MRRPVQKMRCRGIIYGRCANIILLASETVRELILIAQRRVCGSAADRGGARGALNAVLITTWSLDYYLPAINLPNMASLVAKKRSDLEETPIHRIRITLTSRNVVSLEKGES